MYILHLETYSMEHISLVHNVVEKFRFEKVHAEILSEKQQQCAVGCVEKYKRKISSIFYEILQYLNEEVLQELGLKLKQ